MKIFGNNTSYNATIRLDAFGGRLFDHGTSTTADNTSYSNRVKGHINRCKEQSLVFNVINEKQDRTFGNKIICKGADKDFVLRVVNKLNANLTDNEPHAQFYKDFKAEKLKNSTPLQNMSISAVSAARLSEKEELAYIPDNISDAVMLSAIKEVELEWYYVDKSIRVAGQEANPNKYKNMSAEEYKKACRPFPDKAIIQLSKVLGHDSYFENKCKQAVLQGLKLALAMTTRLINAKKIHVVVTSVDREKNKELYQLLANDDRFELHDMENDMEVFDFYMNLDELGFVELIIANPPYAAIGAQITRKIVDDINFEKFINLLPANDYRRYKNVASDLWKHVYNITAINKAFDAAVTTHLCEIKKEKQNITEDAFERSTFTDRQLDRYFEENFRRADTFEDIYLPKRDEVRSLGNEATVIFTKRDCSHSHAPYTKNCNTYKWNVERSIGADYLIDNTAVDFNNAVSIELLNLKSRTAKDNFVKLWYSKDGFRFMSKLFTAVNVDSRYALNKIFARVNYEHEWTVEGILAEYGYKAQEIADVMTDLDNFKGMED